MTQSNQISDYSYNEQSSWTDDDYYDSYCECPICDLAPEVNNYIPFNETNLSNEIYDDVLQYIETQYAYKKIIVALRYNFRNGIDIYFSKYLKSLTDLFYDIQNGISEYTWHSRPYYNNLYDYNFKTCVVSCIITIIYEMMCHDDSIYYTKDLIYNYERFCQTIKNKLEEYKSSGMTICSKWRGSDYYYRRLFGRSIYLKDCEVSDEIIELRNKMYFNDLICGHPKASDGWCKEGLDNLIESGAIL